MSADKQEETNIRIAQHRVGVAVILIGLPLFSNVASFVIFAPLFTPGRNATSADFQRAGILVSIGIGIVELAVFLLVAVSSHREHTSLKSVVNFQQRRLQAYLITGLIALPPTLAAGWLYARSQAQAGIESNLSRLSMGEVLVWYVLTPVTAAFLEETIWRGYAIPRLQGAWRSLLLTSLSFALFHGIFNPLAVVATFVQGMAWGWAYRRTDSTVPGMALHFISRYLAFVPGFG